MADGQVFVAPSELLAGNNVDACCTLSVVLS